MTKIKFYKVDGTYGFLSNFAPYPIFINGERWHTVEHFFQANKFEDKTLQEKIRSLDSPMKAAIEGRNRQNKIRADWDLVKEKIELLKTGNAIIIEHTSNDFYWADGGDGTGKNRLGGLLMKVRDDINKISNDVELVLPPWISFSNISQYDLFWRMGLGEGYLEQWFRYLSNIDTIYYKFKFPEPKDWEGIYD